MDQVPIARAEKGRFNAREEKGKGTCAQQKGKCGVLPPKHGRINADRKRPCRGLRAKKEEKKTEFDKRGGKKKGNWSHKANPHKIEIKTPAQMKEGGGSSG